MPGQFSPPVRTSLGKAGNVAHAVTAPLRAAEILLTEWPTTWTARHIEARKAVLEALVRSHDAAAMAKARVAFSEVAAEAGILLPEPRISRAGDGFNTPDWNAPKQMLKRDR